MAMNIIEDDDDVYYEEPKRTRRKSAKIRTVGSVDKGIDSTTLLMIVGIMGAILVASFLFTGTDCPEVPPCPTYNLSCPECPQVICEKDNITISPVVECIWNNETQNNTCEEINATSVFIYSPLDITSNMTYYLNNSADYKETIEINVTELAGQIGDTIKIRVE